MVTSTSAGCCHVTRIDFPKPLDLSLLASINLAIGIWLFLSVSGSKGKCGHHRSLMAGKDDVKRVVNLIQDLAGRFLMKEFVADVKIGIFSYSMESINASGERLECYDRAH